MSHGACLACALLVWLLTLTTTEPYHTMATTCAQGGMNLQCKYKEVSFFLRKHFNDSHQYTSSLTFNMTWASSYHILPHPKTKIFMPLVLTLISLPQLRPLQVPHPACFPSYPVCLGFYCVLEWCSHCCSEPPVVISESIYLYHFT